MRQSYGATYSQTLLNGFGTASRTRQAEQQVSAARETLRLGEQTVLLQAATAYMNLIRDAAILTLQRSNVEVLQEQLRQTQDRFAVGEVTRTDVAQSEVAACRGARATAHRRVELYDLARDLPAGDWRRAGQARAGESGRPPLAANLQQGIAPARARHPSVTTAMFNVDAAIFQVKIAESSLYPTLTAVAQVQKSYGSQTQPSTIESFSASGVAQLNVPVYQGGGEYATIRQAKETLQQRRVDLDTQRDQVQQTLVQTWGQLEAAKAQVQATQTQVNAAEIALNGVREEARVGQRTTLDVLNAQQELVNARVALVTAQRDRVVGSYTLLAAAGGLSAHGAGAAGADLRPDSALPSGARRLGRRADARRQVSVAGIVSRSHGAQRIAVGGASTAPSPDTRRKRNLCELSQSPGRLRYVETGEAGAQKAGNSLPTKILRIPQNDTTVPTWGCSGVGWRHVSIPTGSDETGGSTKMARCYGARSAAAAVGQRPARPLAHDHLHCRFLLVPHRLDRPDDARRANECRRLPCLCRTGVGTDP